MIEYFMLGSFVALSSYIVGYIVGRKRNDS